MFLSTYFRKKSPKTVAISSARYNLPGLASNLISCKINKFERKVSGKGAVRTRKGFTFFVSNEDMNDIIVITKSLQDSGILLDGVTEKVEHEMKNQNHAFLELC